MKNERLLVLPDKFVKERFGYGIRPMGYRDTFDESWMFDLLNVVEDMPRDLAEKNTNYRQIVPYVLVKTKAQEYLTYTRKETQGEEKLHNLSGIGIGGHATIEDLGIIEHCVVKAAQRELMEELVIDTPPEISFNMPFTEKLWFLGMIAGTEEPVDLVHIGFIFRWDIEKQVDVREKDQMSFKYLDLLHDVVTFPNLEPWTRAIIPLILGGEFKEVDWNATGS